jgi:hypothetical protein
VFVPCHAGHLLTFGSIGQILIIPIHGALPKMTIRNTNAPLQCKVPNLINDAIATPKRQHNTNGPWCGTRVLHLATKEMLLAPARGSNRLF